MISIISSTNRKNSNSIKVAKTCQNIFNNNAIESDILSLENLPEDFIFNNSFGNSTPDYLELTTKYMSHSQKFIFIIPEYNGSYPGVLKAFIDSLDHLSMAGKKACLIGLSSGHAGALRALDHITCVLHHLKIEVYSNKPKLSGIDKLIDKTEIVDVQTIKRLEVMLKGFMSF
jgi:chromate reductase, NAD(P)H dehydrogenase (quinone)